MITSIVKMFSLVKMVLICHVTKYVEMLISHDYGKVLRVGISKSTSSLVSGI